MLKQLQRKIIMYTMILIGIVLFIGFAAVIGIQYEYHKTEVMRALDRSISMMQSDAATLYDRPMIRNDVDGDREDLIIPTYTIKISEDGETTGLSQGNFNIEESLEQGAIAQVFNATASEGKLSDSNLYYKKKYMRDGTILVAFADASHAKNDLHSLIFYGALLFVAVMVILFIISFFLSRMAIRPVGKAWAQQQQFVADASHELKTPLTVILANNDILLSHPEESVGRQSKWVESTKTEATHMKKLVDNLLYLARSDANKGQPVFSQVALGEAVTDVALQFEPVAFEKGIELDYGEIDGDITVDGDGTKLNQLVHILVDNACKYGAPDSTVKITLQKSQRGPVLTVHNEGAPIPAEDLPHLFERFYRSDKARTKKENEEGYGLGLAIAKSIVEDHKGKISVASTEEDGTTFKVILR